MLALIGFSGLDLLYDMAEQGCQRKSKSSSEAHASLFPLELDYMPCVLQPVF